MNRRIPSAAAALAALAVLLTACSEDTGASAAPDPPATSAPTSPPFTVLSDDPDYETPLAAGRYALTVAENVDPDLPWAVVDAPAGCDHFSTHILACGDEGEEPTVGLSYWTMYAVPSDPCAGGSEPVDTVDEAVAALRSQKHSQVSDPSPATIDGYNGLYVELRIPESFDFASCPRFYAWDIDAEGGLPYYQSPGLERLWILDVDGELVVINLSDGKRLALAMVEALQFVPSTD